MEWLLDNLFGIISLLFGGGGIIYTIVSKILDRKKYNQEVRSAEAEANLKDDDFWKKRYDVLQREKDDKDAWWKERYNTLYNEYQNERKLSNEIVKSFRIELNDIRSDYEAQRELEKTKYDNLMEQYRRLEEESQEREKQYKQRISQLEDLVTSYENRLK